MSTQSAETYAVVDPLQQFSILLEENRNERP